jgi:predicted metal-binding membrane protein
VITRGSVRGQPRRLLGIPPAVLGAIAVAWALALAAQATGRGRLLGHDELIHSGLPLWAALGVHLLAWQMMVAAMMLPSSLPLVRLFATVSRNQERPGVAMVAFLAGYAVVWTVFGALAFLGDALLHHTVHATPWLATHPAVIGGGVLALAGAFQFSSLKDRCLKECRHPGGFLLPRYQRGTRAAFRLGRQHGLFCLGCCWAIMLVGFAAGVANLWWMAALTALMVFEKTGREGQRGVRPIGLGLIALGILMLAEPAALPWILGSS